MSAQLYSLNKLIFGVDVQLLRAFEGHYKPINYSRKMVKPPVPISHVKLASKKCVAHKESQITEPIVKSMSALGDGWKGCINQNPILFAKKTGFEASSIQECL